MEFGSEHTGSRGTRLVTAYFEDRSEATRAFERLRELGVPDTDIHFAEGSDSTSAGGHPAGNPGGFWQSLADLFLPEEDRYTYAEGLRRGGYVVSARVDSTQYDRALDILDDDGSIDINDRADSWRSEGWGGWESTRDEWASTGIAGSGTSGARLSGTGSVDTSSQFSDTPSGLSDRSGSAGSRAAGTGLGGSTSGLAGSGATRTPTATGSGSGLFDADRDRLDRDEAIPVVEERLNVGKRDVSHGRVRVRSYVIEQPVREDVTLREERVDVERRPVDRAADASDDLFRERTIEVEERGQEAVVSKEARVTEEVRLRKEAAERTEQIADTVRRTEVEVEDERGSRVDPLRRER